MFLDDVCKFKLVPFFQVRHCAKFILVLFLVTCCGVHCGEALEFDALALHCKAEGFACGFASDVDSHCVELCGSHLRCQIALVYQLVKTIAVAVNLVLQRLGSAFKGNRTDCFVGVLCLFAGLVDVGTSRCKLVAVLFLHVVNCL